MTVKDLRRLLLRFDDNAPIMFEFCHMKNPIIPGSTEVYKATGATVVDALKMDGCVYIATGDCK